MNNLSAVFAVHWIVWVFNRGRSSTKGVKFQGLKKKAAGEEVGGYFFLFMTDGVHFQVALRIHKPDLKIFLK